MQITAFGAAFLPLAIAIGTFARSWLPALIIFSTVLQATSIIDLSVGEGTFGISPYSLVALLAGSVLAFNLWSERSFSFLRTRTLLLLAAYIMVAVAGAFTLPFLFEGTPVNLLIERHGMDRPPVPLVFTLSNAVQTVNLLVHAVVLMYLLYASKQSGWKAFRLFWALGIGVLLVFGIGVYERFALMYGWPSSIQFWMNNPGYIQYHQAKVAGFLRMAAPFSEASYASTFLASVFAGLLALAAFGRRTWLALGGATLTLVALINTIGSTGWVAAGVATVIIPAWLAIRSRGTGMDAASRQSQLRRRTLFALGIAFAVILISGWVWKISPMSTEVNKVVELALIKKLEGGSAKVRDRSNEHALQIVRDTKGLGVGLGSNRASSFLTSLVSNTGIVGASLFIAMLANVLWPYLRAPRLSDAQIFVSTALATATLAMCLAIPDLNLPIYWMFIFLGILFCPSAPDITHPHVCADSCPLPDSKI